MNSYRDPQKVFTSAIKAGVLSEDQRRDDYAGNWMYMGDDEKNRALFKNIVTRAYMPPMYVDA